MPTDLDQAMAEALEGPARGDALIERLEGIDAERVARADPIFPDKDDLAIDAAAATSLNARFREVRDAHRGELALSRSALPGPPGRVAAAIFVALEQDAATLTGKALKARQRAGSEDFLDLQSFRSEADVACLAGDASDADRADALERLSWARSAAITWIRGDPSVLGSHNAIGGLDIRVGDARIALDAVNRYREHQALGFLALIIGVPALIVFGIVVVVIVVALGS